MPRKRNTSRASLGSKLRFVSDVEEAKNSETKGFRFAKRNQTFRLERLKSLRSLRVLNQLFRGIVCFQWLDPRFVSPFSSQCPFPDSKARIQRASGFVIADTGSVLLFRGNIRYILFFSNRFLSLTERRTRWHDGIGIPLPERKTSSLIA